ncbi:MAG: twin-arginine translocase subunit TatC [Armatimonadetes bacterium]|nr:twin-arginine translocase subunit TatC [Armatimonadota bacterium]
MDFMDHLGELRTRLLRSLGYAVVGACAGWFIYEPFLYDFLMHPLRVHLDPARFPVTWFNIMEPLMIRMTVSAVAGVVIFSPLILYEAWAFVYPALLPNERRCVIPLIPASFLLFAAGVALAYLAVPLVFIFASKFVVGNEVVLNHVKWYIPFLVKVCLAMGLVFQMPIVFFILAKLELVTADLLISKWRHAVVAILIAAAIITPTPDPVNMSLLAAPILGLYLLSIVVVKAVERKRPTTFQ